MDDLQLLPLPKLSEQLGRGRSSIYTDIKAGLLTRPIEVGPNSNRWPAGEVRQVIQARIAGKNPGEIRALVQRLHEARKAVPA